MKGDEQMKDRHRHRHRPTNQQPNPTPGTPEYIANELLLARPTTPIGSEIRAINLNPNTVESIILAHPGIRPTINGTGVYTTGTSRRFRP